MKTIRNKPLAAIASAILAIAFSGLTVSAAQFDIVGSNGWTDGWGEGTPDYATDVFAGGATPLSGNAALVFDHVDLDPGRGVDHIFTTPLTGTVEIKFNVYIPGTNHGAFFVAYYMTDAADADVSSWGAAYLQPGSCWIEEWGSPAVTGPTLTRDVWQEIKMVLDFTAGTAQYFKNGMAVGTPTTIAGVKISGFGLPFKESTMGTAFTGPVYLDDFSVIHNSTTIWSENFDSYIPLGGVTANAGADKALSPGTPTAVLGGSPTASGGTGPYIYSWSPTTGLDDATAANPTVTTTDATTTYTVTVTDSLSATATDSVIVTYGVPVVANAGADQALSPGTPSAVLGGSPTASGGTGPYTYSWSPTTGLDDATTANPTVTTTAATTTYTVTVTDSLSVVGTDSVIVTYTVPAMVVDISGNLTNTLDAVVGAGNSARLIADALSYWAGTTSVANVDLNSFQFTINNGGGNGQTYNGAITGPGTLVLQGSPGGNWDPDIRLGGTLANSPAGVTINSGCIRLNKTSGVDALAGPITVNPASWQTVRIKLIQSNQINDASTIDSTTGSGPFHLDMLGLNETISGLVMNTGHFVNTGVGGVLNVTTLTVGGVSMPKGAYTASSGFVTGSGYIDVDNFGPPVIGSLPGVPASPTPADADSTVHPAYLAKLTWSATSDATSYDVYLWLASETKPVTPTATDVPLPEYTVSPQVLSLENYKWQVVAKNTLGNTNGPEWTFSTVDRTLISGNLATALDAIVGAGPAVLTANAMTFWAGTTSVANVNLSSFQFTINNGGGNTQIYNGAISGPGTLRLQGRGDATWAPDMRLGGTAANTPTAVSLDYGRVQLNKTAGVDALAGPIAVTVPGGNTARIQLLANDQISDASTIDASTSSGAFYLELGGFSDTLTGLILNTGHQVDTGTGGVLTVSSLTVGGVVKGPGTYTSTDAFVAGSGSVVVAGASNDYGTWATANAGGQAADLDYDNDGMSNGVEYFMGATGSTFTANSPVVNTAGVLTVTWPRDPDAVASFMVQISDDLSAWTDIVPPNASINASIPTQVTYTLPSGAAQKFCRLVVTP